jgi:hypothetical protein
MRLPVDWYSGVGMLGGAYDAQNLQDVTVDTLKMWSVKTVCVLRLKPLE